VGSRGVIPGAAAFDGERPHGDRGSRAGGRRRSRAGADAGDERAVGAEPAELAAAEWLEAEARATRIGREPSPESEAAAVRDAARPVETVYRPAERVDLGSTLAPLHRGASDPTFVVDRPGGCVWRTTRTELGPATVQVRREGDGVRVRAWGPGAGRAIELAPDLLGRRDDWTGLDLAREPLLAEIRRRHPGLRLVRTNAVFEALAPAILEQKITQLEAHRAWSGLHREFGEPACGAGVVAGLPERLRLPLTPEAWRRIPSWRWHTAGVDLARSSAIVRAARVAASLERALELDERLPAEAEELTRRLRSLPGVGVWTAAETTQRSHGDPDAPSFGDYHVAKRVGWALTGRDANDEELAELLEPYRGHRQRVVRLALLAGRVDPDRARPKFGPRMTVQDHRRH